MPSRSPSQSRHSSFLHPFCRPMGSLRSRVESWIRDQTVRIRVPWPWPPPPPPRWSWLPWGGGDGRREQERRIREEYTRQLQDLCHAVKVDSVADLQDVLCSMILSECVYKRPATEMIRAINKFKSDFGGQIVCLDRVQPALDHVSHRYLLAEAGDTLFISFIGTKQYKDVMADVNIFQGAIFHEDNVEDFDVIDVVESDQVDCQKKTEENLGKPLQSKPNPLKKNSKPAAHRGFLARAKGIPALELYKLAQKKNQKLVLCGHSLGGAVAALATLAILRVLASSPLSKENEKVEMKCITFSQPPVGNAALRDYVHRKGWQQYFKSYCIPEDLVPRILSPAYFHHYNAQTVQASNDAKLAGISLVKREEGSKILGVTKSKEIDGEQLVLGLGPVQTSFWRLSRLVPLDGVRKHLNIFKRAGSGFGDASLIADRALPSTADKSEAEPQSLVIQEGSNGISVAPLPATDSGPVKANESEVGDSGRRRIVPYLPSYVPFGQLYLLGSSFVESLPDAEYSKLTSMGSVITELRERFRSHSMRSYRSRFQKIYDHCMCISASPFLGMEQLPQFPHLQQWLGLAAAGAVELGNIVEPPVIRTATSILPLGWSGTPGEKNVEPLKVDIVGHGLHLCTLVQAQVNGKWCSTLVESLPSMTPYPSNNHTQPDLQKMRILVGAPMKKPPKHSVVEEALLPIFPSPMAECGGLEGLNGFLIYCTSDFVTVSKKVYVRTRRVRLLGLEGGGKTSLFKAILEHGRQRRNANFESIHPEVNTQEEVEGGICYLDSAGVNLQQLHLEADNFKEELHMGVRDLGRKTDLVVLVHNLSQKIPRYHQSRTSQPRPALSLLLSEATALGIPWVLAITNKFSVSAHQQQMLVDSAVEAYQATPSITRVVNSCPFVLSTSAASISQSLNSADGNSGKEANQRTFPFPINLALARLSFQKKTTILPVEGVAAFRHLVHRMLRSHEEMAFQELANERLSVELAREQKTAAMGVQRDSQGKGSSTTAAAVGASLGAGLGLVMAVVMGAASALRKP